MIAEEMELDITSEIWTEVAGSRVVDHYGDWREEHRTLRQGAGLIDLCHRRLVRVTGGDRVRFLQGMLTQDVEVIPRFCAAPAAMCTARGKLIGHFIVHAEDDSLLLDIPRAMAAALVEALSRFTLMQDVALEDVSEQMAHLSVQGPMSPSVVAAAAGLDEGALPEETHDGAPAVLDGLDVLIVRHGREGEVGFDIFAASEDRDPLWSQLLRHGAVPVGRRARNVARIESGTAWPVSELDDTVIPVEAGLGDCISYTKGCYVGQEVIAKIEHLGSPPRQLCALKVVADGRLAAGDTLHLEGRKVGIVTSVAENPSGGAPLALGFVKTRHAVSGTQVTIGAEGPGRVEVIPLGE